jgi:hypothetical protein
MQFVYRQAEGAGLVWRRDSVSRVARAACRGPAVAYGSAVNDGRWIHSFTAKPKALARCGSGIRCRGARAACRGRAVAYGSAVNDGRWMQFVYRQAEGAGWCGSGIRRARCASGVPRPSRRLRLGGKRWT